MGLAHQACHLETVPDSRQKKKKKTNVTVMGQFSRAKDEEPKLWVERDTISAPGTAPRGQFLPLVGAWDPHNFLIRSLVSSEVDTDSDFFFFQWRGAEFLKKESKSPQKNDVI